MDKGANIKLKSISIHAPARGATLANARKFCRLYNFNPRSREGSDTEAPQSLSQTHNFNPRSREGSDCIY